MIDIKSDAIIRPLASEMPFAAAQCLIDHDLINTESCTAFIIVFFVAPQPQI